MEIEVGEYVKLKRGEIFKIDEDTTNYYNSNKEYITNEVVKHSKNIIDLIEVGDIVNGSKVIDIAKGNIKALYLEQVNSGALIPTTDKDIKTILTHEQFQQNAYRLEEE